MKKKIFCFLAVISIFFTGFLTGCKTKAAKVTIIAEGFNCALENISGQPYYFIKDGNETVAILQSSLANEKFEVIDGDTITMYISHKYDLDSIFIKLNGKELASEKYGQRKNYYKAEIGTSTFFGQSLQFSFNGIFKPATLEVCGISDFNIFGKQWDLIYIDKSIDGVSSHEYSNGDYSEFYIDTSTAIRIQTKASIILSTSGSATYTSSWYEGSDMKTSNNFGTYTKLKNVDEDIYSVYLDTGDNLFCKYLNDGRLSILNSSSASIIGYFAFGIPS